MDSLEAKLPAQEPVRIGARLGRDVAPVEAVERVGGHDERRRRDAGLERRQVA